MTSDDDDNKLCPYCPGGYSKLCKKHKEVCDCHMGEENKEKKSKRTGLEKCEVCDKPI